MEIQTTIPHGHETKPTEFCPFQISQEEDRGEYAAADTYADFVALLRRIVNQLDLGQVFKDLSE